MSLETSSLGLLFNSPLETGVRSVIVLDAAYPLAFDLTQLVWFDHLVVHTGDVGGPPSLHPSLPHRTGELVVRRRLLEAGIILALRAHLLERVAEADGIMYRASGDASAFVELMTSQYSRELQDRAVWLAQNICRRPTAEVRDLVSERVGRWSVEFQIETGPDRGSR